MIFVTQTNTGTTVKRIPQEEVFNIKSYTSREQFSPLFRVCYVNVGWRCFEFLVSVKNLFKSKTVKWQRTSTITTNND